MRQAIPEDLPALRSLARTGLIYDPDTDAVVDLLWSSAAEGCRIVLEDGADSADSDDRAGGAAAANSESSGRIIGFALGSLRPARDEQPATGHVELIVVGPEHREQGHGRALLAELERRLVTVGAARLRIRGNPPNFAWPGIDIRYTPAVCLAAAAGYERLLDANSMLVNLAAADLATEQDVERLAEAGIEVRRGRPEDEAALRAWSDEEFGGTWGQEAAMALRKDPPTLHVAVRDGAFLGFAGHGMQRVGMFGPMGTDEAARGLGIGAVLLRRCLADQRAAGIDVVEIGWVGPARFYSKTVGARLGRVFWAFEKPVTA
ncbi:GNAT family N-acetyltransferase [Catenulispora pinisilvae]|uniref:GNAT family N-acetyltransferase n=1 Tax=Catenulispora pinisilvae TaxID=2705253 RepID=UPI0018922DF4|nr:GNAT family N-acetyltransferase [Catenulispora pinisilvae]